ncbi:hypothetical protein [Ralstonia mannitolilytica]|uniref:hypothetical protein n=1 Tax=Ralstonia mannitolilytica TaxID=105219 RepID=UPI00292F8569|nr:hypothetical protein [Ralstonia mannitolilytica]
MKLTNRATDGRIHRQVEKAKSCGTKAVGKAVQLEIAHQAELVRQLGVMRVGVATDQVELPVVSLLHRLPPARLTGYICENSQTVSF